MKAKKIILIFFVILLIVISALGGAAADHLFGYRPLDKWLAKDKTIEKQEIINNRILNEESAVIDVVEKVSPSVVTVSIKKTQTVYDPFENFSDPFGFFNLPNRQPSQPKQEEIEQDIGSGFIVDEQGLVVTNKHVVADKEAQYQVFIQGKDEPVSVEKIYRDPANDLAILKIKDSGLKALKMGDSSQLKVGQFAIAIGTALGEFRNTVTTGVVSGLGRGISAGNPYQGYAEQLDNVIQTDAAINPGNSGGPLLNSFGQAIGVNVAVVQGSENIGFALPINLVKESLDNFNQTGQFDRPFLGVRYKSISKDLAIMNDVPEGAYIVEVVANSPAQKAGLQKGDIISKIADQKLHEDNDLIKIIQSKKAGDKVSIEYYRGKDKKETEVILKVAE